MGVGGSAGAGAESYFNDSCLETFLWSNYYFCLTVIKSRTHKNLRSRPLPCARRARSPWLAIYVLTIVAGVVLLTAPSSASPVNESGGSPELVIDSTRRDFGDVYVGEELDQIFNVRNVGTAPLELGNKTLTSRSSEGRPGHLINAMSHGSPDVARNYSKPAAIKRLAAPT
jgi:hypothetical protein